MKNKIIINPEIEYFIVSLKHTSIKDKYITLWRPDNKGYCWPIELAGKYNGYQQGYHMSEGNIPVPVSQVPAKYLVKDREGRDCIKCCTWSIKFIRSFQDTAKELKDEQG